MNQAESNSNNFPIKYLAICVALLLMLFNVSSHAEMKKSLGDWDVHYIALTSTFLPVQVAKANNILRSSKNALVNISVLDQRTKEAQEVTMTGSARNLLGNTKELTFTMVKEGQAIYYLAQVPFNHKEVLRFDINIQQGRVSQNLKFQQTMYIED